MKRIQRSRALPWWGIAAPEAQSIEEIVDSEIELLSDDARARLAAIWQRRGGLELRVAAGFSALAMELFEHGAPPTVYEIVAQAVRDEVHHAQISVELASKYRGDSPKWPAPEPLHIPPFAPTTGAMHATLYVIAMCCINETIACSVLEAALGQSKSPLVRAAYRQILSDEIHHARAGWAYLASPYVTSEIKRALPRWLRRLLAAKLNELVDDDSPLPGEDIADHGMLSRANSRALVYSTLVEVIFPGFQRVGISTLNAESWARDAFATQVG